ncbi:MAG: glycyl-radical enzyme activating protein [bacterium]|nr:glycyl-radical enzyme activating protein [bacterium]
MSTATVFNIQRFSLHDGPGIRTTVFLKGCPLRCSWCHNPESWDYRPQLALLADRCLGCEACTPVCDQGAAGPLDVPAAADCVSCGDCADACPTGARDLLGRTWSADELLAEILRDQVYFGTTGGGVTFSGGEPLSGANASLVLECLAELRRRGVKTAVDTCGHVDTDLLLDAASLTDLVLFDLKLMDAAEHRRRCGMGNGRIHENLRLLVRTGGRIQVRLPLIPGLTDTPANLEATAAFVADFPQQPEIQLLPYHTTGADKYDRLGLVYELIGTAAPHPEDLERAVRTFTDRGLAVTCGG